MDTDFETALPLNKEDEQALAEFDKFVESVRGAIEKSENKLTILNDLKLEQIKFTYAVLEYLTRGSDVELSYELCEPFKEMGSVSVEGKLLKFDKPEWFARAAEFANNTEVYPLVGNRVRLTFGFHDLMLPLE